MMSDEPELEQDEYEPDPYTEGYLESYEDYNEYETPSTS